MSNDCAELRLDLEAALRQLTPKQTEALGAWLAGYTQQEIGDACGVSKMAICHRIKGAIKRIAEYLGA